MNAVQQPKEDTQAFMKRLLNFRVKVLFVAQESDSKLKAKREARAVCFSLELRKWDNK